MHFNLNGNDTASTVSSHHQDNRPGTKRPHPHDLPTIGDVMRDMLSHRARAEALIRAGDPLAAEILEIGRREGIAEGERNAATRAERAARAFLQYLSEDDGSTPGEIPAINHHDRHNAYGAAA